MLNWIRDRFHRGPVVPVVRLSGVIASGGLLGSRGLSVESVAPLLKRAFETRGAKAVALSLNSPGGSPVQSALIAQRIRLHAAEKGLPVVAFVEDVAASGGYWLACAADEIIADPSSIVGSIGVISSGFGFQDLIARIGVERRVHTSGENKSMLDPFRPEQPDDVERLKRLQAEIHDGFKDWIRQRRGKLLKGDETVLFSGEFWTARRGIEFGLIDGFGELRTTLQARYGDKVRLPVIGPRRRLLSRFGLQTGIGGGIDNIGPATLAALEERALWQRFGL
ncbi:S49 family peptidase [Reyranella sp.]|jgi:signal peptide peptidase SppA|uniref:S49 family peptidase n=1 Tax=Reyranella sp. TaxID=1929291 RepID=UPI000BC491C5|nr:S49 family peptidase [Reyranella sp.]OYY34934.1 MAG: S49 family peptidase [Rhodospirillales bacterium 35-66-84]OYZ91358.1 MAG: S49 family peptidase [Rhodospirillales bacterium 24-66-33]OZB21417.1 MAG: S49 family peptidase [Rhodospirillales bacterium 39-66-50]HQS18223.1 S49 family peptidase [Reyranella sp.]HQT14711.1 S49 family peptidase [Reyranella sp.]